MTGTGAALKTEGLGKRYKKDWVLQNCKVQIPIGKVAALIGPNGAGKTTLMHLAMGFIEPSAGKVEVLGLLPRAQAKEMLPKVSFVSQDRPLYRSFRVDEMLKLGRNLNPGWDESVARKHLTQLNIPFDRQVAKLSGGQQAQVTLAMALAKRPKLLLLDEPLNNLDPLARRGFLQTLMESVAEGNLSVLLSSHIIGELERVCDYLIILTEGQVRLTGDIEQLLFSHKLLTGPRGKTGSLPRSLEVVQATHTERQSRILVRGDLPYLDPAWQIERIGFEDLILAYLDQSSIELPSERPSLVILNGEEERRS